MPLIATGNEDLYFTVSPSPYFTQKQLRDILYDHIYLRHTDEPEDWFVMKEFYQTNIGRTMGVGAEHKGIWYPLPQVELPTAFRKSKGN
jgi:tuberculosinol/isotuberculosinol synthase